MELIKFQHSNLKKCQIKANSVIIYLTIVLISSQVMITVLSFHIPNHHYRYGPMRRQDDIDSDGDEELDSGASAPYQNQDEGGQGSSDGYEDNEPDGPYGETPKDEEGQADLERFFDDHLGASDKDGMDKENLPSNIIPISVPLTNPTVPLPSNHMLKVIDNGSESNITPSHTPASSSSSSSLQQPPSASSSSSSSMSASESSHFNYIDRDQKQQLPNVETRFIHLPNNKLIITRQSITRGPVYKGGLDLPEIPPIPNHYLQNSKIIEDLDHHNQNNNMGHSLKHDEDNLNAHGSDHVIATEDEDDDRVYVTKVTDKPFRISALGGYDPEEDFRDASRDILEEPSKSNRARSKSKNSRRSSADRRTGERNPEETKQHDISFNDPEPDSLFNDASETDEVVFDGPDEPYQTDLEAEMRNQAYDRPGQPTIFAKPNSNKQDNDSSDRPEYYSPQQSDASRESRRVVSSRRKEKDYDDGGEGSWVNDGVDEDIDIPSQSHQDVVLAKAAKQEELARQKAEEEAAADSQQAAADQPQVEEPENQRMDNADYLKNDLRSIDQDQEQDDENL